MIDTAIYVTGLAVWFGIGMLVAYLLPYILLLEAEKRLTQLNDYLWKRGGGTREGPADPPYDRITYELGYLRDWVRSIRVNVFESSMSTDWPSRKWQDWKEVTRE